jgi:hypothetical protein
MHTYSLLTIHRTNADGTIDGAWLQDHIGTVESARSRADTTEAVNSHAISVAVVPAVGFCGPAEVFHSQQRVA